MTIEGFDTTKEFFVVATVDEDLSVVFNTILEDGERTWRKFYEKLWERKKKGRNVEERKGRKGGNEREQQGQTMEKEREIKRKRKRKKKGQKLRSQLSSKNHSGGNSS